MMLASRSHRVTLACCCLAGLGVAAAPGEIVVLGNGRFLKAESYAVAGDRVRVDLIAGGSLELPLLQVDRIIEDEVVASEADAAFEPRPLDLGFSDRHRPPDAPFGEHIFEVAKRRNVNPELITAIIRAESAFDPMAVSEKGARGLMQLMPATGRRFGSQPEELFDAEINLEAGVAYLGDLITRYADDLPLVLAAYNAGEGAVARYRGVPPYRETQEYIRRIYGFLGVELEAGAPPGK